MPGADIRKDILEACPVRAVLPDNSELPVTKAAIATSRGITALAQDVKPTDM